MCLCEVMAGGQGGCHEVCVGEVMVGGQVAMRHVCVGEWGDGWRAGCYEAMEVITLTHRDGLRCKRKRDAKKRRGQKQAGACDAGTEG